MRTREHKDKHAAYMRQYNKSPEQKAKKANYDKSYRSRNAENLRARDRLRNMQPERKAKRLESQRKRYQENKEEISRYGKAYYRANKIKWDERRNTLRVREYMKKYSRMYTLRSHGLTVEQYDEILKLQGGVCAICGDPPKIGINKRLHVDHDHKTGKVRGLLCMHCNHSLERIEKNEGWAEKALTYLARPQ